jgi:hypothetical protein
MRIVCIRHLTLAVRDLDGASATLASLFGASPGETRTVQAFGARTQDILLGASMLQLVTPVDRDGALQRFIERRGEGVYTVALEVEDLDDAIAELTEAGVRVSEPVEAQPGLRSAFVTASATFGMSVQLVEASADGSQEPPATAAPVQPPDEPPLPEELPEPPPAGEPPPPKRALDLTPDEWDEWSDVD